MKKNNLIAGSMAQRKQNCFYIDEEGPYPIQSVFVFDYMLYAETICHSIYSSKNISTCDVYSPSFDKDDDKWSELYFINNDCL